MGPEGWYFSGERGSLPEDPLHGFKTLKQLYLKADPAYTGRYTVPVLWDKTTDTLVNNESSEIIRMFYSEFDHLLPEPLREVNRPGGGLYAAPDRARIDAMNEWVYPKINNGVYKVGFATSQAAYDANVGPLFAALQDLEDALAAHGGPFLLGDHLTEVDVRAFTTLARFDVAYHSAMLCSIKTIRHDFPHLHLWLRRLYWDAELVRHQTRGAFSSTTQPNIGSYGEGYARSRHQIVLKGAGPLIVPAPPAPLVEPLTQREATGRE